MFTKNKIISHLTQKGKKTKSEKILNKSIKELQKSSKKKTKNLIQLSIALSSMIFRTHTLRNKKNKKKKSRIRPVFIAKQNKKFCFAIKLTISTAKKDCTTYLHKNLKEQFFSTTHFKSKVIKTKKELEKQVLNKKYLFKYYRWA